MEPLFNYTDYRAYLIDALAEKKHGNKNFSYRFIARNLGLQSPAFFNLVIKGHRKLSEELAGKVALLFKLNEREREYFIYMVHYTDAPNRMEKQFYYERMTAFRDRHIKTVEKGQYLIYKKWYYSVVLELLRDESGEDDLEKIGNRLLPPITRREVRESIGLLKKIGCIRSTTSGKYQRIQSTLSTGNGWQSEIIHNWQRTIFHMGCESLDTVPKSQRDMSSILVHVSSSTFAKMTAEITKLRQKFLAMAEEDALADKVFVCNFQLFPVTQSTKEDQ